MTRKEYADRNVGVTFDFVRHIIDCPEMIDTIPDGAEIDFIDKDMPIKMNEATKRKKVARYKVQHVFESVKG